MSDIGRNGTPAGLYTIFHDPQIVCLSLHDALQIFQRFSQIVDLGIVK